MRIGKLALAVAMGLGGLCWAEDWPQYRGPRDDGISKETGLLEAWPAEGPAKLWSANVGAGYSSPVAADGKVYVFATAEKRDTLYCFDARKGTELWKQSYDGGWDPGEYKGTRASPVIDGALIYTLGGAGDLVCRKLADGALVWRVSTIAEAGGEPLQWGQASNPLVTADSVYVEGGKDGAVAIAVDKATGKVRWKGPKAQAGYSKPIMIDLKGKPQLVVFGGQALFGLDPATGAQLWTFEWQTSWDVNSANPIFRDGKLFVTSGYGTGSALLDLSGAKPVKLWGAKELKSRFQTPVVDGDVIYGNSEGKLRCLNWADGKVRWTADGFDPGMGGSIVRNGDKLVVLAEKGTLSLVKATPDGFTKISAFKLFEANQVWATPLLYQGMLFAKGGDELVCLDVKAK